MLSPPGARVPGWGGGAACGARTSNICALHAPREVVAHPRGDSVAVVWILRALFGRPQLLVAAQGRQGVEAARRGQLVVEFSEESGKGGQEEPRGGSSTQGRADYQTVGCGWGGRERAHVGLYDTTFAELLTRWRASIFSAAPTSGAALTVRAMLRTGCAGGSHQQSGHGNAICSACR